MMRNLFLAAPVWLTIAASVAHADQLVYLTEKGGEELFLGAEERSDYFLIASFLETEQILTFCGPATIAAVMNSLGVDRPTPIQFHPWSLWTQDEVFNAENQALKSYPVVEHEGLLLEELAQFFTNLGVPATFQHADAFDVAELRRIVRETLADPGKRLVANYSRKPIGQIGDGHISPIAAYDEQTDRVLVLDVARYKYPPVWMTVADMHMAMDTVDPGSNTARGLVVVGE